ncbi:hypothetical protein [Oceanobacillus rekensis]|uniref:hypothetical protein n=1 Tax=Oceanobacillus rekensis TaxID=937927 RepID=UPI000B43BE32|nr:hypothetical protein [Oceanobacillus rekensis]
MVGPEASNAPLYVRQNVYILDSHPKIGDVLEIPAYKGLIAFLYVLNGQITLKDIEIKKQEDLKAPLPALTAIEDTTLVLFFVDMQALSSMTGTISGLGKG